MSTQWVWSDQHLDHEGMIQMANRPFDSVESMNFEMIRRNNSQVGVGDTVFYLGDVCWGSAARTYELVSQMEGSKFLTVGNHDRGYLSMQNCGFELAVEQIVLDLSIPSYRPKENRRAGDPGDKTRVLLNHYPKAVLPPGIDYIVHGHIHNTTPQVRAMHVDEGELVDIPDFNINVSVEMINYMPVPLEWIVKQHIHKLRK